MMLAQTHATLFHDYVVLRLAGELDVATCNLFKERVQAALAPRRRLLLDVKDLAFISSDGICAIVEARHALCRKGGELHVVGASAQVARVFRLLGLEHLLQSVAVSKRPSLQAVDQPLLMAV